MLQNVIFEKAVTVIFKNLVEETLSKIFKFIKTNSILLKFCCFTLVVVLSFVVSIVACGLTLGFNVSYSGKNIAVVDKTDVFDKAKALVIESVGDKQAEEAIIEPEFDLTLTVVDNLCNENKVADAIIENTEDIALSACLEVNGKVVAHADRDNLDKFIEKALTRYYVKGGENSSSFVDDVKVTDSYCLVSDIKDAKEVKSIVNELKVKTVSKYTDEINVAFSTKTVKTSRQVIGYSKVTTKGEKGLTKETAVVETVNGKETAKTVLSTEVVKKPVTQVVLKGTATPMATATERAKASSAGFICPMNRGSIKKISAYWGDGRGHKGIDMAGDIGVAIFASKAGKVVSAGYSGNYGYCVVIDHGNGYQTRYAHASALCVKTGATVSQGQQIARLGNTGRSTGPHLHFEILKNGSQINPSPYIGI